MENKYIKLITTEPCGRVNAEDIIEHKEVWEQKRDYYNKRIAKREEQIQKNLDRIKQIERKNMELEDQIREIKDERYHRVPIPTDVKYLDEVKKHNATHFRANREVGEFDGQPSYLVEFLVEGQWHCLTSTEEDLHNQKLTFSYLVMED